LIWWAIGLWKMEGVKMKSTRFPFLHKKQQVFPSMISTLVTGNLSPFAGWAGKWGQVSTPAILCVGAFWKETGNG
jgi:hypothetical protein